jgi:hypothetical protein
VKKLAESPKTQNAQNGNQRLTAANFGGFQFFHSFSPAAVRPPNIGAPWQSEK